MINVYDSVKKRWIVCIVHLLLLLISYFLLGGYDKEEKAARAYDLAALKYWGSTTHINFPVCACLFFPTSFLCTSTSWFLSYLLMITYFVHIIFITQLRTYEKELEEMKSMSRQEFVANLRRSLSLLYEKKKI